MIFYKDILYTNIIYEINKYFIYVIKYYIFIYISKYINYIHVYDLINYTYYTFLQN